MAFRSQGTQPRLVGVPLVAPEAKEQAVDVDNPDGTRHRFWWVATGILGDTALQQLALWFGTHVIPPLLEAVRSVIREELAARENGPES